VVSIGGLHGELYYNWESGDVDGGDEHLSGRRGDRGYAVGARSTLDMSVEKALKACELAAETIHYWTTWKLVDGEMVRDPDGRVFVHKDVISKAVNAAIYWLKKEK
jgi:hypothetical protein